MKPLEAPPGYRAERPGHADLEAIAEVLVACDIEEVGRPDQFDAQWLAEEWDDYEIDLQTDAWVVWNQDGRAAAYVHIAEEIPGAVWEAGGWVHPMERGRGLGRFLVAATEQDSAARLSRSASLQLHHFIEANDSAARELLCNNGFESTRYFWHMEIELGPNRPRVERPSAVVIAPLQLDRDEREVHSMLETAFALHWGFVETHFERWMKESVNKPWFDASLSFVARENNEIVGALIGSIDHGRGFVNDLAVLEAQRRRGIGAALLDVSFAAFEERGLAVARLNVDSSNETGAVRLYERVGMKAVRIWELLAKEIVSESTGNGA